MRGDRTCSRASTLLRGSLAGATIEVWKAWQSGNFVSGFLEDLHSLFNRHGRAADYGLMFTVNVCDDYIAVDSLQHPFDFGDWGEYRSHSAVIGERHPSHLAATRADGLERVGKGKCASGDQSSVFAKAVSHGEVRFDAVSR